MPADRDGIVHYVVVEVQNLERTDGIVMEYQWAEAGLALYPVKFGTRKEAFDNLCLHVLGEMIDMRGGRP